MSPALETSTESVVIGCVEFGRLKNAIQTSRFASRPTEKFVEHESPWPKVFGTLGCH
jgi:hypothetical protein